MDIKDVITKIKDLDLSTYPYAEIKDLLNQVGVIGHIVVTYNKGKIIMRARPNLKGERFKNSKELSFKPQHFNKTYQRASTPYNTVFYGCTLPDNPESEINERIIGTVESMPWVRDRTTSGYKKITYGKWGVNESINLIGIFHKKDYYEQSNFTKELIKSHQSFIEEYEQNVIDDTLTFLDFLADEFSKENINHDYDYMVSAIFSELVSEKGFDGVIYPSVRTEGKGFNVALIPKASEKLKLYAVGECSIYKMKDNTVVGNDFGIELNGNKRKFKLKALPQNHRAECLEKLGVKKISDLYK